MFKIRDPREFFIKGDGGKYSLVEVSLFHSLLAPLKRFGVLVLERLQICHGPHALTLQTLIVVAGFGIRPEGQKSSEGSNPAA